MHAEMEQQPASHPRPDERDRAVFEAVLERLGLRDAPALDEGLQLFHVRELQRGEYLLRGGDHATHAGLLVSGLLREFFLTRGGVERTKSFVLPMQFTGSLADLLSGQASRAYIVAEAPARLLVAPYAQLQTLSRNSQLWTAVGKYCAEQLVLYKAEREYQFLCLDAEERYKAFQARHPGLEAQLVGRHVASYLGITPVHLSRLRARRARSRST